MLRYVYLVWSASKSRLTSEKAESVSVEDAIKSLQAEVKDLGRKMKGYAGKIGVMEAKIKTSGQSQAASESETSQNKPPQAGEAVFSTPWEKARLTSAGAYPAWKDETECKTCHAHLGAEEEVRKLASCPWCNSTEGASHVQK